MYRKLNEECGVFGMFSQSCENLAEPVYRALFALQHRGQASCGIVVNDRGVFSQYKDVGLVPDVFDRQVLDSLGDGNIALGHVKYASKSNLERSEAQPLVVKHVKGPMAISLNGVLVNGPELREGYELNGAIFHTACNTEIISYAITNHRLSQPSIERAVEQVMYDLKGSYSMLVMSATKLIAVRDPLGFHPLCMGRTEDGTVCFASESCAFAGVGAKFERDILPGEIVVVSPNGVESIKTHCGQKTGMCVFEYVYFARPDSVIEGCSVHKARCRAGEFLWREHPCEADVVIGVPDSGLDAALGFALASGIPYGIGFLKNKYIGRTFIQPTQAQRSDAVRIKLNVIGETVKDKRVVLVDDSIVRGTTCARIVRQLKEAGAREVHMRLSSPPFTNPCYFGTDIDSRDKLIACKMSLDEIARYLNVDSLGYLSVESVKKLAPEANLDFCVGCFTGEYPIDVPDEIKQDKFCRKIGQTDAKTLDKELEIS